MTDLMGIGSKMPLSPIPQEECQGTGCAEAEGRGRGAQESQDREKRGCKAEFTEICSRRGSMTDLVQISMSRILQ